ncbi:MoxR family ATPase [Verrucomicrobiaceae bacterium R5-34]|uniref:MoxR family ATPase n=1 Tax=Oceaniferula flava TaxID=2800421 RepID=A0AAE2SDE9_9BACT|nr:MoxR family ATPase [Oceaniferula flavus]MBK1831490.1 MoxR family ATPase [Verrucomicrobiaceae bacterium R5-34]MBK1854271.1 MoxR family ATPase [Oceaniferula flavus]MBM1135577.1 MoxR family ATPase [Oceaniferula flavus]
MSPSESATRLEQSVCTIIRGQEKTIRNILACLISGGHVLLEDNPGTGKTTLAKAIAGSIKGADFSRIQFTPDLLPSDILGVSILNQKTAEFQFHPGPVFTDILLADEINRASPRTQSALLESMAEQQATIEGKRYQLEGLFFVIATQNPVEFRGTYPLPEAQMDRFAMQCSLGYVSAAEEADILASQNNGHPLDSLDPAVTLDEVIALQAAVSNIRISEELRHYIVALTNATRGLEDVRLSASPRASLSLMKVAQALSLFEGRDFVTPETIQDIAPDVIAHRLVIAPEAKFSGLTGRRVVEDILEKIPAPV